MPLTALYRQDAKLGLLPAAKRLERVQEALPSTPCLKLPDNDSPFMCTIIGDACVNGISAVLLQHERPVAGEGRKLSEHEQTWGTLNQEMLAVDHHLEKWRCYLDGRH